MIQFGVGESHFEYNGETDNYIYSGQCVFKGERLVEVAGGIYNKSEDPEETNPTELIASFTYTAHGDDNNFNLSMYSDKTYRSTIWNTIFAIVDEIASEHPRN